MTAGVTLVLIASGTAFAQDVDGDGFADTEDNCSAVANGAATTNQLDADADGFGNRCDGDLNQDGIVGAPDINVLYGCYFKLVGEAGPPDDPECRESDLNGDGLVGGPDLSLLYGMIFQAPGPSGLACAGTATPAAPCFDANSSGDIDGDLVANSDDNCATVQNAFPIGTLQRDNDHDGIGNACDGDFDNDGSVDASDQADFDICYGQYVPGNGPENDPACFRADMDASGLIDLADVALFASRKAIGVPGASGKSCANPTAQRPQVCAPEVNGGQQDDPYFEVRLEDPTYAPGAGPSVAIDRTHNFFFRRIEGFVTTLEADGYPVSHFWESYDPTCNALLAQPTPASCPYVDALLDVDVFVISKPRMTISPFILEMSAGEADILAQWLDGSLDQLLGCPGGCVPRAMLLILDHDTTSTGYSNYIAHLSAELGLDWPTSSTDGRTYHGASACNTSPNVGNLVVSHPIAIGRPGYDEVVECVTTYSGSVLRGLTPQVSAGELLLFPAGSTWADHAGNPQPADGYAEGIAFGFGAGRVYASGENAMFSAQIFAGTGIHPPYIGLHAAPRRQNQQFLLNVMHWLDRQF